MPGTNRIPDEAGSMTHAKIPEPVNTEKNEITESVSALGIHHSTPLAEEMVDSISVVHEVVLGSDTLRTR